jgi:ferritin-like metal-binding protein YciE
MSLLNDCFLAELAAIYDAENQLVKALPKMAEGAEHQELKEAFLAHHSKTEEHVRRLEEVFEMLGEKTDGQECKTMQALIAEGEQRKEQRLGDALLICIAQKIEHFEMASYGCLRSWAKLLDYDDAASLIEETLDDETDADEHLTSLAVQIINLDARENEPAAKGEDSSEP